MRHNVLAAILVVSSDLISPVESAAMNINMLTLKESARFAMPNAAHAVEQQRISAQAATLPKCFF